MINKILAVTVLTFAAVSCQKADMATMSQLPPQTATPKSNAPDRKSFANDVSAEDNVPPLQQLRNDYNQVSVVAHVRVLDAKVIDKVGEHVLYAMNCQVVELLKGDAERGQSLRFHTDAEEGSEVESFLGEKIVFLNESTDEQTKKSTLSSLENSTLPYSEEAISKLREIKTSRKKTRS